MYFYNSFNTIMLESSVFLGARNIIQLAYSMGVIFRSFKKGNAKLDRTLSSQKKISLSP